MGLTRVDKWRADAEASQREWDRWLRAMHRWLTAAWAFALALNVGVMAALVASGDAALHILAGGPVGNLIVTLTVGWHL